MLKNKKKYRYIFEVALDNDPVASSEAEAFETVVSMLKDGEFSLDCVDKYQDEDCF